MNPRKAVAVKAAITDSAGRCLVREGSQVSLVADGFGFTEGPVWDARSEDLIFSDIAHSQQWRWSETQGCRLLRKPSNQANGNALDHLGRLISCEHASSQLVRHEHEGRWVRVLVSHYMGQAFNSPNDVVVDRQGRIWFTDPTFGRIRPQLGLLREPELAFRGVFRFDPDGSVHLVAGDFNQPNGLCFSPDESFLYVNDSWEKEIRIFEVAGDGTLQAGRRFADVRGEGEGVADGMKVDAFGNVFCNGPGGIHVFDVNGTTLGLIEVPEKSSNFCFGGTDLQTLFITASTSVYRIRTETRGPAVALPSGLTS